MTAEEIFQTLYLYPPYQDFPLDDYPEEEGGWHSDHPYFKQLIGHLKPELVIEVGSWLGGSAINMARLLQEQGGGGRLICVDTWLGAAEFWQSTDKERYGALALKHGYPTVYYQFIANIMHAGVQKQVVPFPQSSTNAAVWMQKRDVKSQLIYIDASHEEMDVYADICAYWPLLEQGGVMFGDDYDAFWPGVIMAVNRFAQENELAVESTEGFWKLSKTGVISQNPEQVMEEITALRAENAVLRAHQSSSLLWTQEVLKQKAAADHFMSEVQREKGRAGHFYDEWQKCLAELKELKGE